MDDGRGLREREERRAAREPERAPRLPLPVSAPTRAFFQGLSKLRGKRIFHPDGFVASAGITSLGSEEMRGTELFGASLSHRGTVRFSRALGIPRALPDFLGLALRVPDAYGPGRHQDLLLVSSAAQPGARHLPLSAVGGFTGTFFSSLLGFDLPGGTRLIGARAVPRRRSTWELEPWRSAAPGSVFELCAASIAGPWRPFARIEVGEILPDSLDARIEMNPWNTGGGIRPTGPMMGLRAPAYEGSVAGRHSRGG
ncbi:MAG: hypothetical protein ACXWFN_13125 [Solirubrobacterales bacterium]